MVGRLAAGLVALCALPSIAFAVTGTADTVSDPTTLAATGSLTAAQGHECNATRIAPGWVITAEHCVEADVLTFVSRAGERFPVSAVVRAPKDDLALLGIAGDRPGAPSIPLMRPGTACASSGTPSLVNTSRIITFRHTAGGALPRVFTPVTAVFASTFRDCSVYNSESTYLTASESDPPAFALCAGDSGSPVVSDEPAGMMLRGVISAAYIAGDGACSNQRPTGTMALADAQAEWIDSVTATAPRRISLRVRHAKAAGQGRVALYGVRTGALTRGPATITWLRAGRAVARRTGPVLTEWTPLVVAGPRTPGRYRVRIAWNGGVRTSNTFTLR